MLIYPFLLNLQNNTPENSRRSNWCFLDSVTTLRFFRIDRAQENLHIVLDICDDNELFILDEEVDGSGDDETLMQNLNQLNQNGHTKTHLNNRKSVSPLTELPRVNIINPSSKI